MTLLVPEDVQATAVWYGRTGLPPVLYREEPFDPSPEVALDDQELPPAMHMDVSAVPGAAGPYTAGPYSDLKRSPDLFTFGPEDAAQFIEAADRQGFPGVPVIASIADLAKRGRYVNPETGAGMTDREYFEGHRPEEFGSAGYHLHGGPSFGLDPERWGRVGWAAEPTPALIGGFRNTFREHAGDTPLLLPLKGTNDLVLGSHGPPVVAQELYAGVRAGRFSKRDALDWINSNLEANGQPRVKSVGDFLDLMRRSTFETRKNVVGSLLPNNPYGHGRGPDIPLPRRDDVVSRMIVHGRADLPTGSPLAAVFVDPVAGLVPVHPSDPVYHPHYGGVLPGINLGHTRPVPLEELLPDRLRELASRPTFQNRPVDIASLLNSAYKSHRHYVSPETLLRLAGG